MIMLTKTLTSLKIGIVNAHIKVCVCSRAIHNLIYTHLLIYSMKIYSVNYARGTLLSIEKTALNRMHVFCVLLEPKFINLLVFKEFSQQSN